MVFRFFHSQVNLKDCLFWTISLKSGLLVFLFPIHVFFYNPKLYLSLRVVVTVMCILGKCGCFPLVPVFYGTLVVSLLFLPHSVLFVFLALPARWVLSCVLPLNFNCSLLSIEFSWNWCLLESWWVRLVEGKSHSHILLYSALTFPVWLTSPSSLARACGLSSLSLQTRQQQKKKKLSIIVWDTYFPAYGITGRNQ